MDIFDYQFELIKELGFGKWISLYPINPVTIVVFAALIGILIIFLNARLRKSHSENNKVEGSSILFLNKKNPFNEKLATQIEVKEINGKKAVWFRHQSRPAIYLVPGDNTLTLYATWASSIRRSVKTETKTLTVRAKPNNVYTMYYLINSNQYLMVEGDRMEDKEWESQLGKDCIVG